MEIPTKFFIWKSDKVQKTSNFTKNEFLHNSRKVCKIFWRHVEIRFSMSKDISRFEINICASLKQCYLLQRFALKQRISFYIFVKTHFLFFIAEFLIFFFSIFSEIKSVCIFTESVFKRWLVDDMEELYCLDKLLC